MKQTYIVTKHAYQRLQERYDSNITRAAAKDIAGKAYRNGKTFEEFVRTNDNIDRKQLSHIFRSMTENKTIRMFKGIAWIFEKMTADKKVNLITIINLEEHWTYE